MVKAKGWIVAAVIMASVLAPLVGCGASENSSASSAEETTAVAALSNPPSVPDVRAQIRMVIKRLEDPAQACSIMSEAFLRDSYGQPGIPGRRKCRRIAERGPEPSITSVRFIDVRNRRTVVAIRDSVGNEAELTFLLIGDDWLLNDAESP